MTSSIHWNPILPLVPLLLSAIIALTLLVILEWRRKQKFKWVRITCQVVALGSVLGLLLRPTFQTTATPQPILILTEGFDAALADSLVLIHPGIAAYCMPGANDFRTAERLTDFRQLKSLQGDPLWVLGNGLPTYSLPDIPFKFQYLPPHLPDGITDLNFTGKGTAERWNAVEGIYFSSTSRQRTLRLLGPGGVEDSVLISRDGSTRFTLSYFPKVAGSIVYKLEERDSTGRTLNSHSLPVSIDEEQKLDIVFVNDYPSFEQRYLKTFLATKGHRVAIRNRVSKDRYQLEFANRAPQSLNSLSSALLDKTDVLIIDQGSFQSASESEKRTIKNAMTKGLGMLLLVSEKSRGEQIITFESFTGPDTVRLTVQKAGTFTLPAATVKPTSDVTPLLVADNGRVLAGCKCTGTSRAGFQLLRETFQLGLEGKTAAYAMIWSPLLERVARKSPAEFDVTMRTPFPWYSNEPIDFDVISAGAIPSLLFDEMHLPLREDANVDALWHGQLWADGNKWHFAKLNDIDSISFAIYDLPGNEWNALRVSRQIKDNETHSSIQARPLKTKVSNDGQLPLVLLLLFVLSSGFLWLAPKI